MGLTVLPYRYRVNGLIDTSQTVMDNIELIGNSCATWLTYDAMNGRWSVVINQEGNPVSTFTDSSVIGPMNLTGTGLADLYNSVEVRFPHRDLNDQEDYIKIEIPDVDRLGNEPDNCLTINLPVINDPVQAQIIGLIELKQARLDKIIDFKTDYSKINLQAGDIIAVTNTVYGWNSKEFRIIRMEEVDQDGAIVIGITALEYSDAVYDLSDLYRYSRSNADGILTQGALGTPSTPSVTNYAEDANPRVDISSTTPNNTDPLNQAGIIEAMEFWLSTDGTNYTLLTTKKPDSALTYAFNTTVTFTYNNVNTSFYVKTRCVNSTTTGAFSSPASVIFAPKQVTDIVKDGTTTLKDSGGGSLATALGIATLINKLGGAFGANSVANLSQAVFSQGGVADQLACVNTNGQGFCDFINTGPRYLANAQNVAVTTAFDSGTDLDIRFRIIAPSAGQTVVGDYIGWSCQTDWPTTGTPILTWGGDNTGTGAESVKLNLVRWAQLYPSNTEIVIECRAFWYGTPGGTVYTTGALYIGGTMVISNFEWVNPTATSSALLDSQPSLITTNTQTASTLGDFIAYFVYNTTTGKGFFTK